MRCPYCGNENPDDHRFCGMCGRGLPNPVSEAAPEPVRPRDAEPAPAYTGGIFNLGAPADTAHRDLNYLLEDEEPKSHGGMILFFVIALALAGGLGYLRWRNGSLPSLRSLMAATKPTPAPAQAPDTSSNPSSPDNSAPPAPPPVESPAPGASNPPASSAPAANPPAGAAPNAAPPAASAATPESGSPNAANAPNSAEAAPSAPAKETPPPADTKPSKEAAEKPAETPAPQPAAKPEPPKAATKPAPKPATKPAAKAPDQVTLGEQYLYGRGVPQNCERGLRFVKPAAEQSNTKAMITMGALYATGHCISRDLPTAYRYFALALRTDPENGPLRQNAEMVWKQMTSEERKQAIRLTQ